MAPPARRGESAVRNPALHLSDVLAPVYEAACDPARWPAALAALATLCGADSALLLLRNQRDPAASGLYTHNVDPAAAAAQALPTVFLAPGITYRTTRPAGLAMAAGPSRSACHFRPSAAGRALLRPPHRFHALHTAGITLLQEDGLLGTLDIARSGPQGAFTPRTLVTLRRLYPHLARALRLMQAVARQQAAGQGFLAVLDALPQAVLLLAHTGRVVHCNTRGRALLQSGDGLQLRQSRLVATHDPTNPRLQQALARAVGIGQTLGTTAAHPTGTPATALAQALPVPRTSGETPYALLATPLRLPQGAGLATEGAVAAAVIEDSSTPQPLNPDLLRVLFGLTPAEARIAVALTQGLAPRDIAARSATSPFTVRTQVRSVLEKLQVHHQSDVVRRVLSSPAVLATAPGVGHR